MVEASEYLERQEILQFAARLDQIKTHRSGPAMKFLVDAQPPHRLFKRLEAGFEDLRARVVSLYDDRDARSAASSLLI